MASNTIHFHPVYSMTGYAKVEALLENVQVSIELKSVNNRFFELQFRMPRSMQYLENDLRNQLREKLTRGTLSCNINVQNYTQAELPQKYNKEYLAKYLEIANQMQSDFPQLQDSPTLLHALQLPDIIIHGAENSYSEQFVESLKNLMDTAINEMQTMRAQEGANMRTDLLNRLQTIEDKLKEIDDLVPQRILQVKEKLQERLQKLLGDVELDPLRLIQEVSVLADKLDISEEITRFRSHNALFTQALQQAGPHGKKLNFLLQEQGREANTLGTKSQHAQIAHIAISIKEEVESMREQVQNLE
jgi:uncharacterized protein (TIGR00255 family)